MSNKVTFEEFAEARDNYQGYCLECKEFTRDCTEPDAREYDCPVCEGNRVYGAEELIYLGLV